MLFGEHRPDEADQRVAVGEDPDDVGAPADLLVEPLLGVVGLMWVICVKGCFQEASVSSRPRIPSKIFCRPTWPLWAASSRCR